MKYEYPLTLHFRLLAFAPRISIKDNTGKEIFYVEQKTFALKEAIKVFNNSKEKKLLYTINAQQIIDFNAKYLFHTSNDQSLGAIQQEGMRSLYQASYSVLNKKDEQVYKVVQTNPMIAVLDSIISMIPFAELLTGFFLNPTYTISAHKEDEPIMIMKKKPSFFESEFEIADNNKKPSSDEELLCLLSLIMVVQLEKNRG